MFLSALALSTALLLPGCDQPAATPPTTNAAATRPSTLPTSAMFSIDGKTYTFDQPRAAVDRESNPPRIMVYSEKENVAGSFYFEVPLDGDAVADDLITWETHRTQRELEDTIIGIQISAAEVLQPQKLRVELTPVDERSMRVNLTGEFLLFIGEELKGTRAVKAAFIAGMEK